MENILNTAKIEDYSTSTLKTIKEQIQDELTRRSKIVVVSTGTRLNDTQESYALKHFPLSEVEQDNVLALGLKDQVAWFKQHYDYPEFELKHKKTAFSMVVPWLNGLRKKAKNRLKEVEPEVHDLGLF